MTLTVSITPYGIVPLRTDVEKLIDTYHSVADSIELRTSAGLYGKHAEILEDGRASALWEVAGHLERHLAQTVVPFDLAVALSDALLCFEQCEADERGESCQCKGFQASWQRLEAQGRAQVYQRAQKDLCHLLEHWGWSQEMLPAIQKRSDEEVSPYTQSSMQWIYAYPSSKWDSPNPGYRRRSFQRLVESIPSPPLLADQLKKPEYQ
jgi:hypothetical protein